MHERTARCRSSSNAKLLFTKSFESVAIQFLRKWLQDASGLAVFDPLDQTFVVRCFKKATQPP